MELHQFGLICRKPPADASWRSPAAKSPMDHRLHTIKVYGTYLQMSPISLDSSQLMLSLTLSETTLIWLRLKNAINKKTFMLNIQNRFSRFLWLSTINKCKNKNFKVWTFTFKKCFQTVGAKYIDWICELLITIDRSHIWHSQSIVWNHK